MVKHTRDRLKLLAGRGQHGRSASPRTFIVVGPYGEPNRGGSNGYCEYYWSAKFDMTFEEWLEVARLSKRYRRFCTYVTETLPRWKVIRTISYADNSTEVVEQARDGRTRQRMTEAPHGDVCF